MYGDMISTTAAAGDNVQLFSLLLIRARDERLHPVVLDDSRHFETRPLGRHLLGVGGLLASRGKMPLDRQTASLAFIVQVCLCLYVSLSLSLWPDHDITGALVPASVHLLSLSKENLKKSTSMSTDAFLWCL